MTNQDIISAIETGEPLRATLTDRGGEAWPCTILKVTDGWILAELDAGPESLLLPMHRIGSIAINKEQS